jgi:hypothetical protein
MLRIQKSKTLFWLQDQIFSKIFGVPRSIAPAKWRPQNHCACQLASTEQLFLPTEAVELPMLVKAVNKCTLQVDIAIVALHYPELAAKFLLLSGETISMPHVVSACTRNFGVFSIFGKI